MKKTNLLSLITEARGAMGFTGHQPPGFDAPTRIIEQPAVASGYIALSDYLPVANSGEALGFHYPKDSMTKPGQQIRLDAELARRSKVAAAGASIIVVNTAPEGMTGGNDNLAMYSRPTHFRIVTPAPFAPLNGVLLEPVQMSVSAYPALDAEISMGDAPTVGVRFALTRRFQKSLPDGLMEHELFTGIAWGLADAIDRVLLHTLSNASDAPAPTFTLGAAAAKSLEFSELKALCGTNGTGAAVGYDGVLRVAGVPAELTGVIPDTIIGAFSRAAVAVRDEIHVLLKRTDAAGNLEVTAYADVQALIPDREFFWMPA